MPGKFEAPKKKKKSPLVYILLCVLLIVLGIFIFVMVQLKSILKKDMVEFVPTEVTHYTEAPETTETEPETEPPTTLPEPEHVVTTATVSTMGDLLMHTPIYLKQYSAACYVDDNSYDFSTVFQYLRPYSEAADLAAVNLETTLAGTGRAYSGFPAFNSPDAIVDGAVDAGFDIMLTANNHCFDTGMDGYLRTLEVCRNAKMDTLGTMASGEEPKYLIRDVNGIKIGMICYTYETTNGSGSYPSLNGNPMYGGSYDLINCFVPNAPQRFYEEMETYLAEMKEAGAEATILFIHWGVEYQTYANDNQKAMAQKLCDLGVDVIVGGHPHVVQPVQLLESRENSEHKTVCIYSLGNAVSNQRTGISELFPRGYTEDGAMFSVTFEKYSDGTVYLQSADVLPTWVNKHPDSSQKQEYNILPLDIETEEHWQELYQLSDTTLAAAKKSYERTVGLVGEGLETCQTWLAEEKESREQYYYDLVFNPVLEDAA